MIRFPLLILMAFCLTISFAPNSFAQEDEELSEFECAPFCTGEDGCDCETSECEETTANCGLSCGTCSADQEEASLGQAAIEFENHKAWFVDLFWLDAIPEDPPGLLAAMMLMTEQLVSNAMAQTQMIGSLFDAKHQLETQRLFQTMVAKAHKDYHPSEELCEIGTIARPLAASNRKSDLVFQALSKKAVDRQILADRTLVTDGGAMSDKPSRLVQFIKVFCDKQDNSENLGLLCKKGNTDVRHRNIDINYTGTIDLPLTLDVDFQDPAVTIDEMAVFALHNNLIAHETMRFVPGTALIAPNGEPAFGPAAIDYLDSRALVAKRSVAANSLSAITAMKARGNGDSEAFIYALIDELNPGLFSPAEIAKYIGENPSYFAQMELLTKKFYQHPKFYSNLYDKPANVLRKDVAIQAAELMQKRDIYRSFLRSEAVLATMLEAALTDEQNLIKNELNPGVETERPSDAGGVGG